MRRSRHDVAMGRLLAIGQQWRSRTDGRVWRVYQVHRADCIAELAAVGMRANIPFAELRRDYVWIANEEVS